MTVAKVDLFEGVGAFEHAVGLLAVPPVAHAGLLQRREVRVLLFIACTEKVLSVWWMSWVEYTVSPSMCTLPSAVSRTTDTSSPSACSRMSHGACTARAGISSPSPVKM